MNQQMFITLTTGVNVIKFRKIVYGHFSHIFVKQNTTQYSYVQENKKTRWKRTKIRLKLL